MSANPSLDAAIHKMQKPITKMADRIAEQLAVDEQVLRVAGDVGPLWGRALVLTDRRILQCGAGFSGKSSVPLDSVTGVNVSKSLMSCHIKVTGPQSNLYLKNVNKTDAEAFGNEVSRVLGERARATLTAPASALPPPAPPAVSDHATRLKELAQLRDSGVITPEDFEAKKVEILGQM